MIVRDILSIAHRALRSNKLRSGLTMLGLIQAIAKLPGVAELVPQVTGATTGVAGQVSEAVTASVPSAHFASAAVTGTTANFLSANQKTVSAGRFFTPEEERTGAKVW